MLNFDSLTQSQYDEENQIQLCWSYDKNTMWLELQNSKWIINKQHGTHPNFVKVYIGGYFHAANKIWVNIDGGTARNLKAGMIGLTLSDKDKVAQFQNAICESWDALNRTAVTPLNALKYLDETITLIELSRDLAKGTSLSAVGFSKELTSAAFLLKALKTGFRKINAESSGMGHFTGSYGFDNVKKYFESSATKASGTLDSENFGLKDFITIAESALPPLVQELSGPKDERRIPPILSTRTHLSPAGAKTTAGGTFAYQSDLQDIPWPRVDAYCFRGDARGPTAIRIATGFLPNATRDDQISQYKRVIDWIKNFEEKLSLQKSGTPPTYTKWQCIFGYGRFIGNLADSVPIARIPMDHIETAAAQIENLVRLSFLIEEGNRIDHDYDNLKALTALDERYHDKRIRVVTDADRVTSGAPIDLRSYQKTQVLGAYVSLTKSVAIARHFGSGGGGTVEKGKRNDGWVYACRAYGGFDLPINTEDHQTRFPHSLNWLKGVPYKEQEIALPGLLDWEDIVACRRVNATGALVGDIYIKKNLEEREGKQIRDQIYQLLMGATQEP